MKFILFISGVFCWCSVLNAAEVQIEGLEKKLVDSIRKEFDPRLEYIKQRPAAAWRADDAAFFLERLLVRDGYVDAEVKPVIRNANLIILQCKPGRKLQFGSVSVNPVKDLTDKQLDNYFMQPLIDREAVKRKEVPYQRGYADEGATNVQNFLKSLGYWQAKVTVVNEKRNPESSRVDVRLKASPGVLHTMAMPTLEGATAEHRQSLVKELEPFVGKAATSERILQVQALVTQFYQKGGYQFAKVSVDAKPQAGKQRLIFAVDSGERFKVRKVKIEGHKKTKTSRFKRYVEGLEGEFFDESKTSEVSGRLLRMGAFQRVGFSAEVVSKNEVDLLMDVEENRAKLLRGYLGFGTFEGGILGLSYSDLNIFGRLQRLNLRGEYSSRGLLGEVSLIEPYFAGEPIQLEARAYVLRRLFDGYDKDESGYEVSFAWDAGDHLNTQVYGKMDYADISSVSFSEAELGPTYYLNTALGVRQKIDFRDDPVLPTKGFHLLASAELGSIQGDASASYFRGEINTSYRMRLAEKQGLKFGFDLGTIKAENDLPIDLRFFSGGANSVRSFRNRHLGKKSISDEPLGGQAYWNASVEYQYRFNDIITAVSFVDAGKLFQNSSVDFQSPSLAAGVGVHLNLPIGPVRFEYGRGISNSNSDPHEQLHFTIGARF